MRLTLFTINNFNSKNNNCILFGPSILPHLGNSVPTLSLLLIGLGCLSYLVAWGWLVESSANQHCPAVLIVLSGLPFLPALVVLPLPFFCHPGS